MNMKANGGYNSVVHFRYFGLDILYREDVWR